MGEFDTYRNYDIGKMMMERRISIATIELILLPLTAVTTTAQASLYLITRPIVKSFCRQNRDRRRRQILAHIERAFTLSVSL